MYKIPSTYELTNTTPPVLKALMAMGVLLAALNHSIQAETFTVCKKGGCDFTTIQSAIDAASTGDVIEISAGIYLVEQTIDTKGKAIILRGSVDSETGAASYFPRWPESDSGSSVPQWGRRPNRIRRSGSSERINHWP